MQLPNVLLHLKSRLLAINEELSHEHRFPLGNSNFLPVNPKIALLMLVVAGCSWALPSHMKRKYTSSPLEK